MRDSPHPTLTSREYPRAAMKRQRWTDRGRFVGGDDAESMPTGPDRVYVNLACINSSAAPTASNGLGPPVVFTETRTANIINKADDYAMSIMRWSSTGVQLPAFVPALLPTATDPNETAYEIGIVAQTAAPAFDPLVPSIIDGVQVNADGTLTIYNHDIDGPSPFDPVAYSVGSLVSLTVGALGSLGVNTSALTGLYTTVSISDDYTAVVLRRADGEPVTGPYPVGPFVAGGTENSLTSTSATFPPGFQYPYSWAVVQATSTANPPSRSTTLSFAPGFGDYVAPYSGTDAVFVGGTPAPITGVYTHDPDASPFIVFRNGPADAYATYDGYSCTITGGRVVTGTQIVLNLSNVPRDFAANTLVGLSGVSDDNGTLETAVWRYFGHAPGSDQYVFNMVAKSGDPVSGSIVLDGTSPPTLWANVATNITTYTINTSTDQYRVYISTDDDSVKLLGGQPISVQSPANGVNPLIPATLAGTYTVETSPTPGNAIVIATAAQFLAVLSDPYVGNGVVLHGNAATAQPYGSDSSDVDPPAYKYAFKSRVYWRPQFESEVAPKAPANNGGDIDFNELSRYYWATDEQHACNVINDALAECWTAMIMTSPATGIPVQSALLQRAIVSAALDGDYATFNVTPAVTNAVVGTIVTVTGTGTDWDGQPTFFAYGPGTSTVVVHYRKSPRDAPPSSGTISFLTTSSKSTPTFVATGGGGLRLLLPAQAYLDAQASDGSPGFAIQMNAALFELFKGFASTSSSTPNAQLQPIVTVGPFSSSLWAPNEVVYTFDMLNAMQLEAQLPAVLSNTSVVGLDATFPCTDTWSPIAAMLIDTQLPIIPEEQSAPTFASVAFAPSATRDSTSSMTDISLDLTTGCTDWLQKINYTPSAQYRWTTLTGTGPIQNMTFQLYWRARFNNQRYVATLSPGGSVEVKLLFQRR